jgi:hypothetical protein
MAELSSREVVRTARLCGEKPANAENNRPRAAREMKDKAAKDTARCATVRPVGYLAGERSVFADNAPLADENTKAAADDETVAAANTVMMLDDEGVGGSEDGSEGEPKKRCCDRYDSSESSDR